MVGLADNRTNCFGLDIKCKAPQKVGFIGVTCAKGLLDFKLCLHSIYFSRLMGGTLLLLMEGYNHENKLWTDGWR